ncbi:MAG: hypothetical protein QOK27_2168 [Gemmatimonadales bacterium]|nr:hypothetical protein [Gemmatimonadales bacterium]
MSDASALRSALQNVRLTEVQTRLVQACVHAGPAGAHAWSEYQRLVPSPVQQLRAGDPDLKRLAALLFVSLRRQGITGGADLFTVLRSAYLREQLRSKEYQRICGIVVVELDRAGVPFVLLRGAALAEPLYGDPALRHAHDIDVLCRDSDARVAAEALSAHAEFQAYRRSGDDALIVDHQSSLPVLIHGRAFQLAYYPTDWPGVWERAGTTEVAGRRAPVLSPVDSLVQCCYRAVHSPRVSPCLWACDAYLLLSQHRDFDWHAFEQTVARSRLRLPVWCSLKFLADELGAAIPDEVQATLEAETEGADAMERDLALMGLKRRTGSPGLNPRSGGTSWRQMLTRLRWLMLPSPAYMRWLYGAPNPVVLPLLYVKRLARFIQRGIKGRFGGGPARPARRVIPAKAPPSGPAETLGRERILR